MPVLFSLLAFNPVHDMIFCFVLSKFIMAIVSTLPPLAVLCITYTNQASDTDIRALLLYVFFFLNANVMP